MKSIRVDLDEQYFNVLWRGLHARERELTSAIERLGPDSDDAALLSNDLVYLRMCKKDMQRMAWEASFSPGALSCEDEFVDMRDLLGPR